MPRVTIDFLLLLRLSSHRVQIDQNLKLIEPNSSNFLSAQKFSLSRCSRGQKHIAFTRKKDEII
jgi:hypothetical protein